MTHFGAPEPEGGLDGSGESDPTLSGVDNPTSSEYDSHGKTEIRTRRGYRFVPSNTDYPVVDSDGVHVTKEIAEEIVAESNSYDGQVFIVTDDEKED